MPLDHGALRLEAELARYYADLQRVRADLDVACLSALVD